MIIKTGTNEARVIIDLLWNVIDGIIVRQTDLTGIDFTAINILKITGTAGGGSGGSGDITAKLGTVMWYSAA